MWRCQPVQERTSYWSRPTSPFAASKEASMVHLVPAEVDPGFGTGRVVGSEPFRRMLDGANDEKDETEDRRGAEGEDCAGGAAGTVDGCGPVATVRSPPEPDLRLEEAAAGAGGPRL